MNYMKIKIGAIVLFLLVTFSCKKEIGEPDNYDPTQIYFLISQPSLASATFLIKCTNYDILLDTVFFTSPDQFKYYQSFGNDSIQQNEEFYSGGYESVEGLWTLRFKGVILEQNEAFDATFLFNMNIEEDEE